ncbi:MAG: type IV toxin-antitoxin system AbiEi family antitoxin domain-containing protein [Micropruina glycogenica]
MTTAQAVRRGVSRLYLSRLADAGLLEQVGQGVYRAAGVPADRSSR